MKKHAPTQSAFTLIEFIIAVVVIVILVALLIPRFSMGHNTGTQTLSNMKQLHLVTQQMALDGETLGNTNLGWPGDTGASFSKWAGQIVNGYLQTNDFIKLNSAPGVILPPGVFPLTNKSALVLYAVEKGSEGSTVFLTTANFTNSPTGGLPLQKNAKPYGDKGFIVFHAGGDGAILLPRQVGQTNSIGSFVPPCGP